MPKIFITREITDAGIKLLKAKKYKLDIYKEPRIIPRKELLKRVKGVDAILSLLTDHIDEEVFQAAGHNLKVVANYAVGFDNVDLPAAARRHIFVSNTPCDEVNEAVAEHTVALILALARRIVEADKFVRAGKYKAWDPMLLIGSELRGKTVGIIGAGRIGSLVAERLDRGFGLKILYTNPKPVPEFEREHGATFCTLSELLKQADIVTLHVPLTSETKHLIGKKEFVIMKSTAFLVNTARGAVVDEAALVAAIKSKRIAGAGLDVYESETGDYHIREEHELKKFDNVVFTPHTASATIEARQAMSRIAAENIIAALEGKTPPNVARIG